MLGRWFNRSTRLDDPSPEKRLLALEALFGEADELDTLLRISAEDDDSEVREHAVQRVLALIRSHGHWHHLAHEHIHTALIRSAQAEDIPHLLANCDNAGDLAGLIVKLPQEFRTSLLTHEYFCSDSGLQTLERASRNKDKKVNRHARSQLETLKQHLQAARAIKQRCEQIDQSLEPPNDDLARADKLLTERQELADQMTSLASTDFEFSEPMTLAEPPWTRADWQAALNKQQAAEQAAVDAAKTAIEPEPEPETATEPAPTRPPDWHELEALFDFPEETSAHLPAMNSAISKARRAVQALQLPVDQPTPDFVAEIETKINATARLLEQLKEKADTSDAKLNELLATIQSRLDNGQINSVPGSMKEARNLLNDLPKSRRSDHEAKLAELSSALSELRDWQKFATEPKRQSLLDELQVLAEQPEEPPTQAARIKSLRDQWRQLGRPNNSAAYAMQEQFDHLAEQAFAPCEAYYQEQAQIRADNLSARQALCDQLDNYLEQTDWPNADFRAAEQILRTARQEWRNYHPCERKPLKPVEQKFEALQNQLHGRLKAHWDANVAAKQALVDAANDLLELDDGHAQVEQVKALQQRWKQVGATPRGVDQRLWKSFRKACDEIFSQRDGQRAEAKAERQAHLTQLADAIKAYQSAADTALKNLSASQEERQRHEANIEAIPLDPRGELKNQLRTARDTFNKAFNAQRNQSILVDIANLEAEDQAQSSATASESQLHACLQLTLEAEIAAEVASPEADQSARMALQVELMNQGIRDFSNRTHQDWLNRWQDLMPTNDEALRQRFFAALRAIYS